MAVDLSGKVVIITGASAGIGQQTALQFAKEGACVVLAARRKDVIKNVLGDLAGGPQKHLSCPTDISKDEDVKRLVAETAEKYGKIDILVNNAAISYVGRVKDMDLEMAERVLNINLVGTIRVARHVLPYMIKQMSGHIINISSIIGRRGVPYRSIYCVSKFGIEGFAESLRPEVERYNINVSVIRPPSVKTDFSRKIKYDSDVEHHTLDSLDPGMVARTIINVAKSPKRDVNMGALAKGFLLLSGVFPKIFDKIMRERQTKGR